MWAKFLIDLKNYFKIITFPLDIASACGEDSTTDTPKVSFFRDVKTGAWRVHVASKRFAKK